MPFHLQYKLSVFTVVHGELDFSDFIILMLLVLDNSGTTIERHTSTSS